MLTCKPFGFLAGFNLLGRSAILSCAAEAFRRIYSDSFVPRSQIAQNILVQERNVHDEDGI